jgi:predicted dehydrogenase
MRCIRDHLRQGLIGEVFAVDLTFHNAYGPDKPWFYDAKLSGGGCVTDLGVHLVDLFLWSLDFPRVSDVHARLFSGGRRLDQHSDVVEDYAAVTLEIDTGAIARIACSWRLNAGCDADISAVFYGDQGALALANVDGSFYDFTAEFRKGTRKETLVAPPDAWGGRAVVAWAEQLSRGAGFDASAERYVRTAETLDLIYGRKIGIASSGKGSTTGSRTRSAMELEEALRHG